jgi:N utilization substance protein A
MDEEENTASVIVPDRQLSLAIGKEGQNARLAAKLTGWRIDIKPESAMSPELAAEVAAEQAAIATAEPAPAPVRPKEEKETAPAEQVKRAEEPEPWMEVVEAEEGAEAEVAPETATERPPATAAPAAAGGLRFAEDLAPAMTPAPKKTKKGKGKGKAATDEAAEEKGKKAARKGRRLAAVVEEEDEEEEDIDFETGLDQFGWSEEDEEKDADD